MIIIGISYGINLIVMFTYSATDLSKFYYKTRRLAV